MAATDFIRSLVGWRPSSIGGPVAPEEDEPRLESDVSELNQVASSTLDVPPVSLVERRPYVEPTTCNAPETPGPAEIKPIKMHNLPIAAVAHNRWCKQLGWLTVLQPW